MPASLSALYSLPPMKSFWLSPKRVCASSPMFLTLDVHEHELTLRLDAEPSRTDLPDDRILDAWSTVKRNLPSRTLSPRHRGRRFSSAAGSSAPAAHRWRRSSWLPPAVSVIEVARRRVVASTPRELERRGNEQDASRRRPEALLLEPRTVAFAYALLPWPGPSPRGGRSARPAAVSAPRYCCWIASSVGASCDIGFPHGWAPHGARRVIAGTYAGYPIYLSLSEEISRKDDTDRPV